MKKLCLVSVVILIFVSCTQTRSNNAESNNINVPTFCVDSCYQYIAEQTHFGARVPNSEAHKKCGDYIISKFNSWGINVIEQSFVARAYDGTVLNSRNIIAEINPEASRRIMLCAHWDSRPFCDEEVDSSRREEAVMGANDGASGVAVLMELARLMSKQSVLVGVDIILFDSEDYGAPRVENSYCLGSQYWSVNKHKPGYNAMYGILLDMVGAEGAQFYRESASAYFAKSIQDKVYSIAIASGYGTMFVDREFGAITDDHYYVNTLAKIPCVDIIDYRPETGFPETWHTTHDVIDNISKNTLYVVGDVITKLVYSEK